MKTVERSNAASELNADFYKEYSEDSSIRKYTKETAGYGISHLLDHDYGKIYLDVINRYIPKARMQKGIRLWEFGCGGGMNLLHLVSLLERWGIALDCAYGTDFSDRLIEAANRDAKKYLTAKQNEKLRFCVARNENLIEDVTKALGIRQEALLGSFDLILGVNTIRYCHRLMNQNQCVGAIFKLLADGGVCVVIDMNDKFPAFRSRFHDRLTKKQPAIYLPSLDEYAHPFLSASFEILKKENFCWIPHSAGPALTIVMKALSPMLNALGRSHAMRSLVISRKSEQHRP
jgi:2-polyprenyl-3-methyl-5-hydroxy-6-metoxy-1,4-benzoquinol methylase